MPSSRRSLKKPALISSAGLQAQGPPAGTAPADDRPLGSQCSEPHLAGSEQVLDQEHLAQLVGGHALVADAVDGRPVLHGRCSSRAPAVSAGGLRPGGASARAPPTPARGDPSPRRPRSRRCGPRPSRHGRTAGPPAGRATTSALPAASVTSASAAGSRRTAQPRLPLPSPDGLPGADPALPRFSMRTWAPAAFLMPAAQDGSPGPPVDGVDVVEAVEVRAGVEGDALALGDRASAADVPGLVAELEDQADGAIRQHARAPEVARDAELAVAPDRAAPAAAGGARGVEVGAFAVVAVVVVRHVPVVDDQAARALHPDVEPLLVSGSFAQVSSAWPYMRWATRSFSQAKSSWRSRTNRP